MKEAWKPVPGYKGRYEVSNLGRVRSLARQVDLHRCIANKKERVLKPCNNGRGYYYVRLCDGKNQPVKYVHRIVGAVFVPNPNGHKQIDHINRDSSDNRAGNLRWCSASTNQKNKRCVEKHTSKYNGVSSTKGRWRAYCHVKGKQTYLGIFKTEVLAARAFDAFCTANKLDKQLNFN